MADQTKETRDRVRELVREVLRTVPIEGEIPAISTQGEHVPEHVDRKFASGKDGPGI